MPAETYPRAVSTPRPNDAPSLSSRRGVAILILLCLVQFMDVLDASIPVAIPFSGSTCTSRMRERSITRPPSTAQRPAGLWPPPRTAISRPRVWPNARAAPTSFGSTQRAMAAGPPVDQQVEAEARPLVLAVAF